MRNLIIYPVCRSSRQITPQSACFIPSNIIQNRVVASTDREMNLRLRGRDPNTLSKITGINVAPSFPKLVTPPPTSRPETYFRAGSLASSSKVLAPRTKPQASATAPTGTPNSDRMSVISVGIGKVRFAAVGCLPLYRSFAVPSRRRRNSEG